MARTLPSREAAAASPRETRASRVVVALAERGRKARQAAKSATATSPLLERCFNAYPPKAAAGPSRADSQPLSPAASVTVSMSPWFVKPSQGEGPHVGDQAPVMIEWPRSFARAARQTEQQDR
jgi:hypothetical protein